MCASGAIFAMCKIGAMFAMNAIWAAAEIFAMCASGAIYPICLICAISAVCAGGAIFYILCIWCSLVAQNNQHNKILLSLKQMFFLILQCCLTLRHVVSLGSEYI